MFFDWGESKNQTNREKHGIWFEEAETIFMDPYAIRAFDEKHSQKENRFLMIGISSAGRILLVVHCYEQEEDTIRIISARKATKKEREVYEKGI